LAPDVIVATAASIVGDLQQANRDAELTKLHAKINRA
jgi:hypothetical protein